MRGMNEYSIHEPKSKYNFFSKLVWLNMNLADNEVFIKFWHHTLNADASRCDQID